MKTVKTILIIFALIFVLFNTAFASLSDSVHQLSSIKSQELMLTEAGIIRFHPRPKRCLPIPIWIQGSCIPRP